MSTDAQGATTGTVLDRLQQRLGAHPTSLYAVLALGAALRLFGLGTESLWIDEHRALTYVTTRTPLEVAVEIPFFDPHPPLYYVLLDLWTMAFGVSEPAIRSLSAIFGIAAIPMLYLVGRELYDERVGLLAAGILALSPFHLRFSQTARMYALFVFTTLLSMYLLLRLRAEPSRRTTLAYLAGTALLVYSHVFGLLVVGAQHCYVVASRWVREDGEFAVPIRRWAAVHAGVLAIAVPWGIGIGQQAMTLLTATDGDGSGLSWIPDPTLVRLVEAVGQYLTPSFQDGLVGFLVLVVVAILAAGSRSRVALDRERTLFLACWVGVPVLGLFVVSYLLAPLFTARYTSAALPAVALLVGKEVRRISGAEIRAIAIGLLLVALVAGLPGYYGSPQYAEWEEAATYIGDDATAEDLVLVHFGHAEGTLGYYLDREAPAGIETAGISGEELERIRDGRGNETRAAVSGHDTVWITLHDVGYQRRAAILGVMNESGFDRTDHREFEGVTVHKFVRNGSEA